MKRVMVVGPGAGKLTLALQLGRRCDHPVRHVDLIHWTRGWIERDAETGDSLTREVHAEDTRVLEGDHPRTFDERAARADTLVWLDRILALLRVSRRRWRYRGRTRPDLPPNCPERIDPEVLRFVVRTRRTAPAKIARRTSVSLDLLVYHLKSAAKVRRFLGMLP